MKSVFTVTVVLAATIAVLGAIVLAHQLTHSEAHSVILVRKHPGIALTHRAYIQEQAKVLLSPEALGRVIATPEISQLCCVKSHADPQQWLQDAMVLEFSDSSEIIVVSLHIEGDAETAELLLDRVVDVYISDIASAERSRHSQRLERCRTTVRSIRHAIKELRQERQLFIQNGGERVSKYRAAHLTRLDYEIMEAECNMALCESEIEFLGLDLTGEVDDICVFQPAAVRSSLLEQLFDRCEHLFQRVL